MRTCPNCGRLTKRTKDWACQWCGYPLMSKSYKALETTYSEVKGEKPREGEPPESELELEPEPELEPIREPEPVAEIKPKPVPKPEPVAEVKPRPAPRPELVAEIKPKPAPRPEPVAEVEPEPAPEPEPLAEAEPEPAPEPEVEPAPEPQPAVVVKPRANEFELDVDELYSLLKADKAAMEAKYKDRTLKVSGLVYRTILNENLTIAYVILVGPKRNEELQVTCTFDKKYEGQIRRLTQGETVTVEGKYDGYTATVLMRDCVFI